MSEDIRRLVTIFRETNTCSHPGGRVIHRTVNTQFPRDIIHTAPQIMIDIQPVLDGLASVENGCMGLAERVADVGEGCTGDAPAEEHGNLPGTSHCARTALARHVCQADVVVFCNSALDLIEGNLCVPFLLEDIAEKMAKRVERELAAGQ